MINSLPWLSLLTIIQDQSEEKKVFKEISYAGMNDVDIASQLESTGADAFRFRAIVLAPFGRPLEELGLGFGLLVPGPLLPFFLLIMFARVNSSSESDPVSSATGSWSAQKFRTGPRTSSPAGNGGMLRYKITSIYINKRSGFLQDQLICLWNIN